MSKVFINEETLTNIGMAIREKTGKTNLIAPGDMPKEIKSITSGGGNAAVIEELNITSNGTYAAPNGVDGYNPIKVNVPQEGGPPASTLSLSDDCSYAFGAGYGIWDWFIESYGNQITTNNLTNCKNMFCHTQLSTIPFTINLGKTIYFDSMFDGASSLIELPEFNIPDSPYWNTITWSSANSMFRDCENLLHINTGLLKILHSANNIFLTQLFYGCDSLNELIGVSTGPANYAMTSNKFNLTFGHCLRIKDIIFDTDNGVPHTRQWKNQIVDMSVNTGWGLDRLISSKPIMPNGISNADYVGDDATYQANKNNPKWFTDKVEYSRYNHDSAVNTIKSLPDTSAYGTNTIKFKGEAGSATDGGAINTLTEEEIAMASIKGWTVAFA